MANTLADCDRIVAAARASKAQLSVGLQCRLSPQWGRIRTLIDEGAIGRPQHVHVSLFRHPYRQGSAGWRYDKARVGSWILEEPVHFFDLALWYLARSGRPVKVQALGAGQPACSPRFPCSCSFRTALLPPSIRSWLASSTIRPSRWWATRARRARPGRLPRRAASSPRRPCASSALAPMTSRTCPSSAPARSTSLPSRLQASIQGFRSGKPLVSAEEGRAAVAVCLAAEASANQGGRPIAVD